MVYGEMKLKKHYKMKNSKSTKKKYGGYLPKAQKAGQWNNTASLPEFNLPVTEVVAEAPLWVKYVKEYEKKNPKSEYVSRYISPLARRLGNTETNYPARLDQEYEQKALDYASKQLIKAKPKGKLSRAEWLNSLSPKEEELVKRNPKFQSSLWDDTKRGLISLVETNPVLAFQNILKSKDFSEREKSEMLSDYADSPILSKLGDAAKIFSPITVGSKVLQSAYRDDTTLAGALRGEKNDASALEDFATDLTNLSGLGIGKNILKASALEAIPFAGSAIRGLKRIKLPSSVSSKSNDIIQIGNKKRSSTPRLDPNSVGYITIPFERNLTIDDVPKEYMTEARSLFAKEKLLKKEDFFTDNEIKEIVKAHREYNDKLVKMFDKYNELSTNPEQTVNDLNNLYPSLKKEWDELQESIDPINLNKKLIMPDHLKILKANIMGIFPNPTYNMLLPKRSGLFHFLPGEMNKYGGAINNFKQGGLVKAQNMGTWDPNNPVESDMNSYGPKAPRTNIGSGMYAKANSQFDEDVFGINKPLGSTAFGNQYRDWLDSQPKPKVRNTGSGIYNAALMQNEMQSFEDEFNSQQQPYTAPQGDGSMYGGGDGSGDSSAQSQQGVKLDSGTTESGPSFGQKVGAFAKGMWKGANADNILLGTKALNNLLEKTPDYDQFQRNYKEPGQSMSRGDWTTNQGFLQPNRLGYFDKFSVGTGSMQFGGEVDMTDDEIYEFLAAGGELEFID